MTDKPTGLRVFGFGGHARSIADVAVAAGIGQFVFADEHAHDDENFLGFPVIRAFDDILPDGWQCFPAAGDNRHRQAQAERIQARGWPLATIIAPTATIGIGATIGAGTFVGHHCHIGPMARIGQACILNTGCIVEHDCVVGDFTHVSVNATLAGRSRLGSLVFLGTGATVIDKCTVPDQTICGAGTVVQRSPTVSGTYVGVPARLVKPSLP